METVMAVIAAGAMFDIGEIRRRRLSAAMP
jgi:hypothetical protein